MTTWESYQEQTTETLTGIVETTARQIALISARPEALRMGLRVAQNAHDAAVAELATR